MTDIFSAISDQTRRHILDALASSSPLTVSELVAITGEAQPTVSKHLKTLREAGLVSTETVGQNRFYSLDAAPLAAVSEWLTSILGAELAADLEAKLGEVGEKVGTQVGSWLAAGSTWVGEKIAEKVTIETDTDKLGRELGRRLADAKHQAELSARQAEKAARVKLDHAFDDVKRRFSGDHEGPQTD